MENQQKPSLLSSFTSGAIKSGASGVLMSSIFYTLAIAFGVIKFAGTASLMSTVIGPVALMATSVALFGGIMAVKRAIDESHSNHHQHSASAARAQTIEQEPALVAPMIAASISADKAPEMATEAPAKSWTERTGNPERSDRVQQILSNGALSDKSRASAILSERQSSAQTEQTR